MALVTTLTILGCGTSSGVPLIGCRCRVCRSRNPKNHRLRAAAWIQSRGQNLLIDTSTDLRAQALKHQIPRVDGVLYTHPHADHIHGIDELRSFNFLQRSSIPVYGNKWTCEELRHKFEYIFRRGKIEGGGVPRLILNEIKPKKSDFVLSGVPIQTILAKHGSKDCLGFRIDSVAYLTDCSYIPNESLRRLVGLEALILDCVRLAPHPTHLNLEKALEVVMQVKPKKTYLTHLGHDFDYETYRRPGKLPNGIFLAYDGLKIKCPVRE